jgi:hypothetical protein
MFRVNECERVEKVGRKVIWLRLPSMDICYSRDGWQMNVIVSLQGTKRDLLRPVRKLNNSL